MGRHRVPKGTKGVYLLHAPAHGWYKIGSSGNIDNRAEALAGMVPFTLVKIDQFACHNAFFTEQKLLRHYDTKRVTGIPAREWFLLDATDVAGWRAKAREFSKRSDMRPPKLRTRMHGYSWSKEALERMWARNAARAASKAALASL